MKKNLNEERRSACVISEHFYWDHSIYNPSLDYFKHTDHEYAAWKTGRETFL